MISAAVGTRVVVAGRRLGHVRAIVSLALVTVVTDAGTVLTVDRDELTAA